MIFSLPKYIDKFLYRFNLFFNTLFRLSLLSVLLLNVIPEFQNVAPVLALISLETICFILYVVALTKILYTKSDAPSIYFQKNL